MQPIQQLLNRIRWDSEFSKGTFALGYYDYFARGERVVPITSIMRNTGESSFSICGDDGVVVRIPLHRVRTVYKNGEPIWPRPARPGGRD